MPHISRHPRAAYAQTWLLRTCRNFCPHRRESTRCAPSISGAEQELPPFVWRGKLWWELQEVLGLEHLSILGLLGCGLAIMLGLRLLRAIQKSGHLDQS